MTDDILKDALEAFKQAEETEAQNREEALEDIRFAKLGEQWPETIKQQRETEGRPCLTINKMNAIIRQVVNDSRQNRPAIKVHPADSKADPETADVISGMIRNIEQSSDADVAYDTGIENAVAGGFGYWRVNLDYAMGSLSEEDIRNAGAAAFEKDICIRRVANPFSVFGDPYSQQADSSDWNQCHVVELLTKDQFKKKYPGAEETDWDSKQWVDASAPWKSGDTVQVAEFWQREQVTKNAVAVQMGIDENGAGDVVVMFEDEFAKQRDLIMAAGGEVIGQPRAVKCYKVKQHVVSGVEVLSSTDWAGSYIPIVPVYGDEVNVEGKRYFRSLIRDAKDAARMFNYWRTTATELVALAPRAPFIGEEGSFDVDPRWNTANTASHAYLEFKKGGMMPQRQPFAGIPAGMLQEALNASDDIKAITGIYDASLGAKSNETSGRAIMARQREGDVSTFHFIDNLSRSIRHTGRIIIDLIPKVYTNERMQRILGEDGTPETVKINAEQPEMEGQDDAKEALRIHDVRIGRYDVTVSSGPSFTSRREEARIEMMEMIRSYPDAAPIIGDLLAKNLDWPGADEIAERLKKMLPPQLQDEEGQIPPELQQQLQQMSEALQVMGQKLQEAEGKNGLEQQKLAIEEYKAETERMTALAPAMGPEQIQAIVLQTLRDLAEQELPQEDDMNGPSGFPQPEFMPAQ
jgi:Phage P22-like portal protein